MESLRIGMFTWESHYAVKVGGIAPHITELSETLADKGHEVHVFVRAGDLDPYEEVNGVHYQRVTHDQSGGIVHQMDRMCDVMVDRLFSVEEEFGRMDILHGHDWHPVNALSHLRNQYGRPFVFTYHSTEWGRNGNSHGDWYEYDEISHREWLGAYEAQEVIVTSNVLWDEVQMLYQVPDYKLNLVPNGIVPGKMRMDVDPGRIKEKYGIHPLAPMVLFVGRMRQQKGPDLLMHAIPHVLDQNWDVEFVFAGEGDLRPHCEYLAHELGVADSCRFLGYVSDETLKELINACDMMAVPSRNEPFGIVVLEAWDAGKPVIATDAVGLVDNFENGIKSRMYPESIAWCINNVIKKPDALRYMGEKGRQDIQEKYNWDHVADQTLDVYKKLL